ncbi:MAG: transcriptional regulator [Chromatiales bacterium 21-64-14]|nr:MAG: transcriptional regulator [Chromatiales bacterium 21-64-14]HQU14639.1 helix-turn-helix domain-containing protein [Gammaproteobacteria bacterium]
MKPPNTVPSFARSAPGFKRSPCPITNTLDVLGDRWTLLVVRDLFLGKRLFGEFSASPEGIPTNILADRLKRLEREGVLCRIPYQERPVRYAYTLTDKGRDLSPVLEAMMGWANRHIPETARLPRDMVEKLRRGR